MQWKMVGWSHHHTPVEIREQLAFTADQVAEAIQRFNSQFPRTESVLLSTCNRVELYCASTKEKHLPNHEELGKFIAEYHELSFKEVSHSLTRLHGEDSIRHLFTVAASLDSMVVGEAQILSQVKSAYEIACEHDTVSIQLHKAFQHATLVAKRVSTETGIHKKRISIPSVAVSEIASEFFEKFDDKSILLIGAGEMGTETLRYLLDSGASKITIVNRSTEKAESVAQEFGASVATWEQLYPQIAQADLIVSTTGASEPVVRSDELKKHQSKKYSGAKLILDLAVPRDIEPDVGNLADVYLYTLDDLQKVCERNVEARKKEWPKAKQIVTHETTKFFADIAHRGSGSTIKQLRQQADQIKKDEFGRLRSKLENKEIPEEAVKDVEIAFDRLVNKILHPPLQSLRDNSDSHAQANLLEALRKLFQLKDQ